MEQFIEVTTLDDRKNRINMITMCAWCKRLKLPGQKATDLSAWVKLEGVHSEAENNDLYISHGICPYCKRSMKNKNVLPRENTSEGR